MTTTFQQQIEHLYRTRYPDLLRQASKLTRHLPEDFLNGTLEHLLRYPPRATDDIFRAYCIRLRQVLHEDATRVVRTSGKLERVSADIPDVDVASYHYGKLPNGRRIGARQVDYHGDDGN